MTTAKQLRNAGVFVPSHVPDHEIVDAIHFSKVGTVKPMEEIAAQLATQGKLLANLSDMVTPLVTRSIDRKTQAKKAGCSRTTLWRRERKQRLRRLVGATPKPLHGRRAV